MKKKERRQNIEFLSKKRFKELAVFRDLYCISIYLSTHQKGQDPLKKIQRILNKYSTESQVKREVQGLNIESIEQHTKDLKPIIDYWENSPQLKSISFFLTNQSLAVFQNRTNIPFEVHINHHFYLKYFAAEFGNTKIIEDNFDLTQVSLVTDIEEIIKLSNKGEINKLYLSEDKDVVGELDEENEFILINENEEGATSLSNIAAVNTILNDGEVILIDKKFLPASNKKITAIRHTN